MKAIIINNLLTGGAEKIVLTLLKEFHNNDEPMQLICLGTGKQIYQIPNHVTVHYLTDQIDLPKGILKFFYLFKCAFLLKKIVKKNNIDWIQGHLFASNFVSVLAKTLGANINLQLVNHSQVNFDKYNVLIQRFSKYWFRWMFMKIDVIISISKVMKADLDSYLDLKNHPNHIVIPNPHPISEIQQLSNESIDDFYFDENKKYLITACRIHERKKIDTILKAHHSLLKEFPNLELIILGEGALKESLEQMAINLGINKQVHFLGFRSNPYKYLAKADLFLLSSRMEGLPNIIIESMICGTPVISSDCISGPREILNPNSDLTQLISNNVEYGAFGILFPIGKPLLMAKAIRKCLNEPEILNQYEDKLEERIKTYDSSLIIQKYLSSFKPLLAIPSL